MSEDNPLRTYRFFYTAVSKGKPRRSIKSLQASSWHEAVKRLVYHATRCRAASPPLSIQHADVDRQFAGPLLIVEINKAARELVNCGDMQWTTKAAGRLSKMSWATDTSSQSMTSAHTSRALPVGADLAQTQTTAQ